jgi:hypothetical protein
MSPLQLISFANKNLNSDDKELKQIASCLYRIIDVKPKFGWKEYEKFHAEWEYLYRYLFSGQTKTMQDIYKKEFANDKEFVVNPKEIVELPHHFPQGISDKINNLYSEVMKPADGNPGFDIINFEKDAKNKKLFAIAIECRFSQPGTTTFLSLDEVKEKRRLTDEAFKKITGTFFFFFLYLKSVILFERL